MAEAAPPPMVWPRLVALDWCHGHPGTVPTAPRALAQRGSALLPQSSTPCEGQASSRHGEAEMKLGHVVFQGGLGNDKKSSLGLWEQLHCQCTCAEQSFGSYPAVLSVQCLPATRGHRDMEPRLPSCLVFQQCQGFADAAKLAANPPAPSVGFCHSPGSM